MSRKLISDLKSCLWKKTYYTMDEANKYARKMDKKYGNKSRTYQCKKCGGYHLTTKPLRSNNENVKSQSI